MARLFRTTVEGVRAHQRAGTLHSIRDERGALRFSPTEIRRVGRSLAKLARQRGELGDARTPGEIAAAVFTRLQKGQALRHIVVAERLEPAQVLHLRDEYQLGFEEAAAVNRLAAAVRERASRSARGHRPTGTTPKRGN